MTIDQFWRLIEESRQGHAQAGKDVDTRQRQTQQLERLLSALPLDEVIAFDAIMIDLLDQAYSWTLWGAAYVIGGGCSDDSFLDFREWLVSMGREVFEQMLADPDSLADMVYAADGTPVGDEPFFEGFGSVAPQVILDRGVEIPDRNHPHPDEPSGMRWHEDTDDLQRMLPRIWQRHALQDR